MGVLRATSVCVAITVTLLLSQPAHAEAINPSFDCAKAAITAEKVICDDKSLSAQDHWLDLSYRDALLIDPNHAGAMKADRLRWLRQRNKLCGLSEAQATDEAVFCLRGLYSDRIVDLSKRTIDAVTQSVAHDPAAAAMNLRPLLAPRAKLYAALLIHASSDEDIKAFAAFVDDMAEEIARDNHEDHGADLEHLSVPCELVDQFPRLLLASRAYFGSTMDRMLPDIDCTEAEQVFPTATHDFLVNDPATQQNWLVRCRGEGTIFTAYERERALHELRLARFPMSYLSAQLTWTDAPDEPWPDTREIEESHWSDNPHYRAAKDALAQHYRQHFGLSASEMDTAATRALWDNRNKAANPAACLGED